MPIRLYSSSLENELELCRSRVRKALALIQQAHYCIATYVPKQLFPSQKKSSMAKFAHYYNKGNR